MLIPRAAVARDVLPKALAARGAQVDVVEAYRTVLPSVDLAPDSAALRARRHRCGHLHQLLDGDQFRGAHG